MRLKELRKEKKLTQYEMGGILNVAPTTYLGYEKENYQPTIETLCKLADFYNVTLDYLVGREYKNDIGYLNEQQKTAMSLVKELNQSNLNQAIAYMSGLYVGQKQ